MPSQMIDSIGLFTSNGYKIPWGNPGHLIFVQLVPGKLTVCYWTWPTYIVDLPIRNCDFPIFSSLIYLLEIFRHCDFPIFSIANSIRNCDAPTFSSSQTVTLPEAEIQPLSTQIWPRHLTFLRTSSAVWATAVPASNVTLRGNIFHPRIRSIWNTMDFLIGGWAYPSEKWWSESQLGWLFHSQYDGKNWNSCSKPPTRFELTSWASTSLRGFLNRCSGKFLCLRLSWGICSSQLAGITRFLSNEKGLISNINIWGFSSVWTGIADAKKKLQEVE